ncbi:MAG: hypothetical protein JW839_03620 [Candidatus Lokiarchaeota archaeon]|nr:hypothetical protein [Candidatus Lokiarchaeota archaeon]
MSQQTPPVPARKKLSRQSWMFLLVGLPLFTGLILVINGYMVVNGMIMAMTAAILFVATVRKKNFGIRFTRASFIAFTATFLTVGALVENPALWLSQVQRHAFKSTLIQPDSEKVQELEEAFKWWLDNRSADFTSGLTYYADDLTDTGKPMEDEFYHTFSRTTYHSGLSLANFTSPAYYTHLQKLLIVDYFVQNMVMDWTDDSVTWDVSDHVPVPDEALSRWHFSAEWRENPTSTALQAWDDCDGIAVVTVSFLRRLMGQGLIDGQAFVACGKSHWFTAVKVNDTTPFVFLNHWASVHVYGIFMGDNTVMLGQNLLSTMEEALIVDEEGRDEVIAYLEFLGLIPAEYFWLVEAAVIVAAVLFCIIAVALLGYPRDYDVEREREHVRGVMDKYKNKPRVARAFLWLFAAKIRNPFGRRHLFFWINVTAFSALLVGGIHAYFFGILGTALFPYATLLLYAGIFGLLLLLDRDVFVRAFKGIHKLATGREFSLHGRAP